VVGFTGRDFESDITAKRDSDLGVEAEARANRGVTKE